MGLLPKRLQAFKQMAQEVGVDRTGASLTHDGGCDAAHNRQGTLHASLIPNLKEHLRNRKRTKRGRQRLCNATHHALRARGERAWAWEDPGKRLLWRFEPIQPRP